MNYKIYIKNYCWKSFVDVLNKVILKLLLYCIKISFFYNLYFINVLINVRICLNFFIIKILKIIREFCSSKIFEKFLIVIIKM